MPDEAQILGVPSVGPNGEVTAYTPNPPWVSILPAGGGVLPRFADVGFTSSGYSTVKYYRDVFGTVHLSGLLSLLVAKASNVFHDCIYLDDPLCIPDRNHMFTSHVNTDMGTGLGTLTVVEVRVEAMAYPFTKVQFAVYRTGAPLIPLGTYIPLNCQWETY